MKLKSFSIVNLVVFALVSCGVEAFPSSNPSSTSDLSSLVNDSSLVETDSSTTTSVASSSEVSSSISSSVSQTSSSSTAPLTSLDRINLDLASLSYTLGAILPARGPNRSNISWVSSHPNIITTGGAHIEIPVYGQPETVTLTATATHGGLSGTRTFEVNVNPITYPTLSRSVKLPFVNTSEEYIVTNKPEMNVFFTETGTVPYMDVETFMGMLDGAIDFPIINFVTDGDLMVIDYRLEDVDDDNQPIYWDYEATLNFANNTLTVTDFSFFGNYVKSTETNFSDGLVFLGGIGFDAVEVVFDLDDYRIDLVRYQDLYLAPLSILNLFFLHSLYYDVYYNGETLYGFDTFTALDSTSPVINQIRTTSLNSQAMSKDLRQLTYHFLALAFDYFYGLKEDKEIESFYTYLNSNGYANQILTGNDQNLYQGLFSFAYGLDDLHTWHEATGFYEPTTFSIPLTSLNQLGPGTQAYYQGRWAKEDLIEAEFGVGKLPPAVRLLDNNTIAVIFLSGFNVDTPTDVKTILDELPVTVDDVIIDLSFNGGGNVGAVIRLFGYMTEEPIQYSSMNPTDGSAATYFYESDYVAFDYNWHIMTSSVTFSAANLMASMAKEMGVATIIGTKSSGGAASIGLFVTPDGTLLLRSTLNVFANVSVDENENRTYTSVEAGVPVDYVLYNTFNNADIIAVINQIRSDRTQ
jgi:carboxyl-terminal processing protease